MKKFIHLGSSDSVNVETNLTSQSFHMFDIAINIKFLNQNYTE